MKIRPRLYETRLSLYEKLNLFGCHLRYVLTCSMLSIAWTPRSRFSPPQRTLSTQDTMPERVTGSKICVGAGREEEHGIADCAESALTN